MGAGGALDGGDGSGGREDRVRRDGDGRRRLLGQKPNGQVELSEGVARSDTASFHNRKRASPHSPLSHFKIQTKGKGPSFPTRKGLRREPASPTAMHPTAPPASSAAGFNEDDDFHWDDAAEAELQAIEAAYASASASASAKRRRLPDWTSPSPSPSPSCRPRYSSSPVSGGSTPPWVLSPHTPRGSVRARQQQISFSGKIVYCRTPSEAEKAATDILGKIESMKATGPVSLGFDLEWRPFPRRGEPPCKVAVMQLCMEKTVCYVVHIAHSGVPPTLKSLLEDSSSIKVGICIDNDARKMFNGYDVCVKPLMDLSNMANIKLAGPPKRWSLASLTKMITCKELPKPSNIRMGNWEADVLSKHQLQYAATDAYISWYLYEVLKNLPDYNCEAEIESVKAT